MTTCTSDKFWHVAAIGCGAELLPWLRDRGSLTRRIRQHCKRFAVDKVSSGLAQVTPDESALLSIRPGQLAYTREVFLYADDQPVVFAHTALAPQHLRGVWAAVRTLGNKPLGELLFAHPSVERMPLHYHALRAPHPLYRRAIATVSDRPPRLWARRSIFYLHETPLLVTEIFLPSIRLLRYHDQ